MPTKPAPSLTIPQLKDKIKEEAAKLKAKVTINKDGSIILSAKSTTGETISDSALNNFYTILKKWSDPLESMIRQNEYDAAQNFQKKILALEAADRAKQTKLKQLLNTNADLQQVKSEGYTSADILQGLISLKKTPEQIFNSGYQITYGEIKANLANFEPTQKADFNTWENSIEGPDKCVKQGILGYGSKSTCYIKDGKYISKGGLRKRSLRRQHRRSRKVSRK